MMISEAIPGPSDPVSRIMMWPVAAVPSRATMRDVAESLAADEIGILPVTSNGAIVGVVSERDVARHLANGANPDHLYAADIMTTDVLDITPDTEITAVAQLMLESGVRHLLVLDGDAVAGIVSVRDVLAVLTTAMTSAVTVTDISPDAALRPLRRRVR
jgi:CBS domain-containing protein